jgi:hypothetical protein
MIIRISNANLPGVGKKKKTFLLLAYAQPTKDGGAHRAPKGIYKTCVIREDVVNQLNEHPKG